jgi:hypothetical protein
MAIIVIQLRLWLMIFFEISRICIYCLFKLNQLHLISMSIICVRNSITRLDCSAKDYLFSEEEMELFPVPHYFTNENKK